MAIIACPECGQKVSSTAPACPACGHAVAKERRSRAVGLGCGGVLLILFILLVIGSQTPSPKVVPPGTAATAEQQPAGPQTTGKILPFYVDQASASRIGAASSAQIVVAVRSGAPGDWAATAAAIAKEAVSRVDYAKVVVLRENPAGYEIPWGLKDLAIAYYGPNPKTSPWPTDPFRIFLAERVATDDDIVFEQEYNDELERLSSRNVPPERMDSIALKNVQQKHHLKKPWEMPLSNMAGASIAGADVLIEGDAPPGMERVRKCLADPTRWSFSCK